MKKRLAERISVIDNSLKDFLPKTENLQSVIYDAMSYSMFAGGKRLRPILMWEVSKLFDNNWDNIKEFACAIEMIHTYSLIHDDLPAMDNDDIRRGMPTNHIKYGENIAILAGDGLLNKAFEVALKSNSSYTVDALKYLANASGTEV